MNETVTVDYASKEAMQNAVSDLLGAGIPQDKFYVDEEKLEIKVITPTESKPEILELLNRHTTR
ncbi:MAG: hypothetical protein AB7F20_04200 [Geoalkalibacter sp.]|jgi:hypothetical protein|uniref:hypothetical protein n=1 Tax=Geoalkalibacter sp. TaxID=3041440 RepID=UPI002A96578A|nr:hypothetical protein [Thermodesulfobacteriota bacterium]